jgi:5'-deoxynucleotidase YfbR-like HD superfamily hydrolase
MQPDNFITTYTKRRFSPHNPVAEDIDIRDIAHALSLICRANGHFTRFFSVARHCINCCLEGRARGETGKVLPALLLHDACEAYISDVTRPVKLGLPDYVKAEKRMQSAIWKKFEITPTDSIMKIVGEIDDMMLKLEFEEFAGETVRIKTCPPAIRPDFGVKAFGEDEREFLALFKEITGGARAT